MSRLPLILALAGLTVSPHVCTGAQDDDRRPAAGDSVTQRASMVLAYPHDHHVMGELPPNLDTVPGATAHLTRTSDRVTGVVRTRLGPGRVGKLLAVVINNPSACEIPTPGTACGPHEEEYNVEADGGFFLGEGGVAGGDGTITLRVTIRVGDASNALCGGAANPEFNACTRGFALRAPHEAEVTLVVLDNGPASDDPAVRAQQVASPSPCPTCPPFTAQVAIGFGSSNEQGRDPAR